jgi:hypothetical protein
MGRRAIARRSHQPAARRRLTRVGSLAVPRPRPLPNSRRIGCRRRRFVWPGRQSFTDERSMGCGAKELPRIELPMNRRGSLVSRALAVRSGPRSRPSRSRDPFSVPNPKARTRSGCQTCCPTVIRRSPRCAPSSRRPSHTRSRRTPRGATTAPGDRRVSTRPVPGGVFQWRGPSDPRRGRSCSVAIGPRGRPDHGGPFIGRSTAPARCESSRSSPRATLGPEDRSRSPSEEEVQDARPEWFWFLVASFQPRCVPPTPFYATLTGYPSPGPSGLFHPVTLMGFGFRQKSLQGGFPHRPTRGSSGPVCPPRRPPHHRDEVHRSGPASIPSLANQGRSVGSFKGSLPPESPALCQTLSRLTESNALALDVTGVSSRGSRVTACGGAEALLLALPLSGF